MIVIIPKKKGEKERRKFINVHCEGVEFRLDQPSLNCYVLGLKANPVTDLSFMWAKIVPVFFGQVSIKNLIHSSFGWYMGLANSDLPFNLGGPSGC